MIKFDSLRLAIISLSIELKVKLFSSSFFLYFLITAELLELKIDIGAIIGWDIYQGDQDILPNSSIGLVYEF